MSEWKTYTENIEEFVELEDLSNLDDFGDMSELGDNLRREKYLRQQLSSDVAGLLSLFDKPDTAKLVR